MHLSCSSGNSSVLSFTLEYYNTTFAMKEVKSHILVVIHAHLAALPWHHLHPSLQDVLIFSRVQYNFLLVYLSLTVYLFFVLCIL